MPKPKKVIDIIFLTILGLCVVESIYMHFSDGYLLSVNNFAAFVLWLFVTTIKIKKSKKEYFGVFVLLLLSTFNLINFTVYTINSPVITTESGVRFIAPGFNIVIFLLLLIYSIINAEMISFLFRRIFKGSDDEQQLKNNKIEDFYYSKFANCDKDELDGIFKKFNDYPLEARKALNRLKAERN